MKLKTKKEAIATLGNLLPIKDLNLRKKILKFRNSGRASVLSRKRYTRNTFIRSRTVKDQPN